jgi:hypothetical protein
MSEPFQLRFEGGDRHGQVVPIPRSGLLVGRRSGNDLQLDQPSVSGRHALVRPDGDQVFVEDLGSTNGTRVDGQKVERSVLRPGARIVFGDVAFSFVGSAPSTAAPAPAPTGGLELEDEIELAPTAPVHAAPSRPLPATAVPAARSATSPRTVPRPAPVEPAPTPVALESLEPVRTIDGAKLARTRSSPLGPWLVGLGLLAAGGGATWWWSSDRGTGDTGAEATPALVIPGNLWSAGDFEGEGASESLTTADDRDARLFAGPAHAASGAQGLGVELRAGPPLLLQTSAVPVRPGQTLAARASLAAEPAVAAAVGVELWAEGGIARTWFWSDVLRGAAADEEFRAVEARALVRPGHDRARVWVAAALEGSAAGGGDTSERIGALSLDDLALAPSTEPAAETEMEGSFSFGLALPGRSTFALHHLDQLLFTARAAAEPSPVAAAAPLGLGPGSGAGRRRVSGDGLRDVPLQLVARAAAIGEGGRAIATVGADGFRERSRDFESEGVTGLVLGRGLTLVRLGFERPVTVVARARDEAQEFTIDLAGADGFEVQVDFTAELAAALDLATRARSAQREGRVGDVIALWTELRSRYPFEEALVREAEEARSRWLAEGLAELEAVERELLRARFFGLPGIYSRCAERVQAIASRFTPTAAEAPRNEVLERAELLAAQVIAEREALAAAASPEPARRRQILDWLERTGADSLAGRLRDSLAEGPP